MHLFFDTVWKLHIGEIPEKPDYQNCETRLNDACDVRFSCCKSEYNAKITAIKQNALTVGNPELVKAMPIPAYRHLPQDTSMTWPQEGEFYKWPGGYETKEITGADEYGKYTKTVAILTLPEEKKNTMENADIINSDREDMSNPIEAIKNLSYHCLQWEDGEIKGYDENKMEGGLTRIFNRFNQIESENTALREALKELLPIAERKFNGISIDDAASHREYIALKAIIERARNLLNP